MKARQRGVDPPVVLVVEPDPVLRELIGMVIEEAGYEPLLGESIGDAAVQARREPPSVVLTEITEGSLSRIDPSSLDAIWNAWPHTPIILCTSHLGAEALDATANGFHSIIVKPFELETLVGALRDAIAVRQRSSDLLA